MIVVVLEVLLEVQTVLVLVMVVLEVLVVVDQMVLMLLEVQVHLDKVVPANLIHMEYYLVEGVEAPLK